MRRISVKTLLFFVVICICLPCFAVSAADETVALSLSCSDPAYMGSEIGIRITASKPSSALAGLEFVLRYDPELVEPIITENEAEKSGMDSFIVSAPSGWEQMSSHSEEESCYHIRFAMPDSGNSYLDSASELVLEIPFAVLGAGNFKFSIDSSEIISVKADDLFTISGGRGSELEIAASGESEKVSVSLSGENSVPSNASYPLYIEVTNLGDSSGLIALEFALEYDKTVFAPKITDNTESQMDAFMAEMPANGWEQMCSLDEENGVYTLRFAAINMGTVENEKLVSGRSLTICVPFAVCGSEGDVGAFSVSANSIIGVNGVTEIVGGGGSNKSVSVDKPVEGVFPTVSGFELKNGYLFGAVEKTDVNDFNAMFGSFYLVSGGKRVESGYVKTGYVLTDGVISVTVIVRGDANANGTVDATDYALIKRTCLLTFEPGEKERLAMAIVNGEAVTPMDYMLAKRHVLKTFDINTMK
ncbi:MAG: hypothetical protein IJB49_08750 [Clostridia bacterium]|nr:hypothetical protein [Clostridia bacterium]